MKGLKCQVAQFKSVSENCVFSSTEMVYSKKHFRIMCRAAVHKIFRKDHGDYQDHLNVMKIWANKHTQRFCGQSWRILKRQRCVKVFTSNWREKKRWQNSLDRGQFRGKVARVFFLRFYLFIFTQRRREGEREGEKHQCVVASCMPPTGDPVSYTHLTLPTKQVQCRSRWSPYH